MSNYFTPSGRPTNYHYVYPSSLTAIQRGDIVQVRGQSYVILLGLGTRIENPALKLHALAEDAEKMTITAIASKLSPLCLEQANDCTCKEHQKWRSLLAKEAKGKQERVLQRPRSIVQLEGDESDLNLQLNKLQV